MLMCPAESLFNGWRHMIINSPLSFSVGRPEEASLASDPGLTSWAGSEDPSPPRS